jgi:hypothetical protein
LRILLKAKLQDSLKFFFYSHFSNADYSMGYFHITGSNVANNRDSVEIFQIAGA